MSEHRFDELDRQRTIKEVERRCGIKLSRFGRWRKVLTDDSGNVFVVIGGVEDWHGIPEEIVRRSHEGTLVIAKREGEQIKVFSGPLRPLTREADKLYAHEAGHLSFTVEFRSDHANIKQTGARLSLLSEFTYGPEERAKDQDIREARAALSKLTPAQRDALATSLEDG